MLDILKNFFGWLISAGSRERETSKATDKLLISMRTTAQCRYNAAARLRNQSRFSFFTTTLLSLGLVFVPLMQNTGVPLALKANVLNMMQIFLGVAVLVYSIVIGTARYDLRAKQLTECGDKLKDLIRAIRQEREVDNNNQLNSAQLEKFQGSYARIISVVENHERNDYHFATLDMRDDYLIKGLPRFQLYCTAQLMSASSYILPLFLILMEVVFISDMVGATNLLTPYLNGNAVKQITVPANGAAAAMSSAP